MKGRSVFPGRRVSKGGEALILCVSAVLMVSRLDTICHQLFHCLVSGRVDRPSFFILFRRITTSFKVNWPLGFECMYNCSDIFCGRIRMNWVDKKMMCEGIREGVKPWDPS